MAVGRRLGDWDPEGDGRECRCQRMKSTRWLDPETLPGGGEEEKRAEDSAGRGRRAPPRQEGVILRQAPLSDRLLVFPLTTGSTSCEVLREERISYPAQAPRSQVHRVSPPLSSAVGLRCGAGRS